MATTATYNLYTYFKCVFVDLLHVVVTKQKYSWLHTQVKSEQQVLNKSGCLPTCLFWLKAGFYCVFSVPHMSMTCQNVEYVNMFTNDPPQKHYRSP